MNLDTSIGNLDVGDSELTAIIISISIYGSITVIGLSSIILFLIVQIIGRKIFSEFPFFSIVWYLTLINLLHLLTQAIIIFPSMIIDIPDDGPLAIWQSCGVILVDYTDQTIMYFTLLMALNRFAVFVWKKLQDLFSTYQIKKLIWLTLLLVIPIVAYRQIFGSKKKFNKKTLNFDDMILTQSSNLLINMISVSLYTLPIANLILYLIIYIFLRKQRSQSMYEKGDNDVALLYQAITVTLFLEMTRVISVVAPMLRAETWVQWVLNILRSVCSILNHSLNPILFLTTNRTVRGVLKSRLFICRSSKSTPDSTIGEKFDPPQQPMQIVMTF